MVTKCSSQSLISFPKNPQKTVLADTLRHGEGSAVLNQCLDDGDNDALQKYAFDKLRASELHMASCVSSLGVS